MLYLEKEINYMKKIIKTNNAPAAIGPYNQAILSNNTLYCSGQIAIKPETGDLVIDNITNETTQIMNNILAVLQSAKMDFSNVVKCSIFMKNLNNYVEVNKVYSDFFTKNYPAREAIEVSALPKDVNIEISVIAVK